MKVEYKGKVYEVVKETDKMYYITKSKRVRKNSCKKVDNSKDFSFLKNKKEVKNLKGLKVDDKVFVLSNGRTTEGYVSTIFRENNAVGTLPFFNLNNDTNVRYSFKDDIKVYKF